MSLTLMALQVHSQNILTEKNRVETFIDSKGDTLVIMTYEDARILLKDVLEYEYADSLLIEYKGRDSLNNRTITLQKEVIMKMSKEKKNLNTIIDNLNKVNTNKDSELTLKDDIIKKQKNEIRKQKFLKIIGFISAVILPVVVLLVLL